MELLYRLLLRLYPRRFRTEHQALMLEMLRVQRRRASRDPRPLRRLRFWLFALDDLLRSAIAERSSSPGQQQLFLRPARPPFLMERYDMLMTRLGELRLAARRLRHAPVFSLTAVAIIALGIGANSAIFSFVDATMLRPAAYADADEVVSIYQDSDAGEPNSSSFPAYRDMTAYDSVFSDTMALMPFGATLVTDDGVERLNSEWVTAGYFSFLGLTPVLGRGFLPENDVDGGEPVAVLSYTAWQRRFGGAPSVLGTKLRINGTPVTIVGVGPQGYGGILPGFSVDLWLSLSAVRPAMGDYAGSTFERRADHWFLVRARLAEGVTVAQAQAAMDQLAARLEREFPEFNAGRRITVFGADDVRFHPSIDGQVVPLSAGLMTLVGLVLLIACANLANLLLVRGSARARDVSIRLAIGASRGRVVWDVLAESLVLSVVGGLVGLLLAFWATRLVGLISLPAQLGTIDLHLDARVFAFTALLSLATGVLFGLLPGWRVSRSDVVASLRDDVAALALRPGRLNLRTALAVGQVAMSFLILLVAGLLLRSLGNTQRVPLDFHADQLALLSTNAAFAGYSSAEAAPIFETLRQRVESLPGVEAAALAAQVPVRRGGGSSTLIIDGYTPPTGTDAVEVLLSSVGPAYFQTVGIPIIQGRSFQRQDIDSSTAITIVSAAMARAFWGDSDVVGKRFRRQGSQSWIEIVGVAADVQVRDLAEAPTPHFYLPLRAATAATVIARVTANPAAVLAPMREALREADPLLSVTRLETFQEHVAAGLAGPRLGVRLLSMFGLLGLGLASLGLYAVVAFAVERRTTELGIRVALGAGRTSVIAMVVREVLTIIGLAVLVGLGLAAMAVPAISSNLYGVSGADPLTILATCALLALTGALAAWVPARRAARIDPVEALRHT